MFRLKLTQIGNSLGVVLPKQALSRLKLKKATKSLLQKRPKAIESPRTSQFLNRK